MRLYANFMHLICFVHGRSRIVSIPFSPRIVIQNACVSLFVSHRLEADRPSVIRTRSREYSRNFCYALDMLGSYAMLLNDYNDY
jgi:hypothetical protein